MKRSVTWLPAHPSYGSVSMRRYWSLLKEEIQPEDPYQIRSLIRPEDEARRNGWKGRLERLWQRRIGYPFRIRTAPATDLYHVLDHSWGDMLPHIRGRAAKVVTVHDLIPLRFPGELSSSQAGRFRQWTSHLQSADAIISVSEYTKREVMDLLCIAEGKIHVVPNGVNVPDFAANARPLQHGGDVDVFRIGSIGSILRRKNLVILPEALARLKSLTDRKIVLVRAGAPLPSGLLADLRNVLGEDGVKELGRISDEELAGFYQSVDVMAVPSLYEGFGLPVIEAMAWKVPVISSNATSLPEVGGDAVLYFNPESPEEFADQLTLVAKGRLPPDFVEKAYQRASLFTWRRTLEGYYDVYRSLLES